MDSSIRPEVDPEAFVAGDAVILEMYISERTAVSGIIRRSVRTVHLFLSEKAAMCRIMQ